MKLGNKFTAKGNHLKMPMLLAKVQLCVSGAG